MSAHGTTASTSPDSPSSPTSPSSRMTRRRALAGAAWSVPVITIATAAPAHAMSGPTQQVTSTTAVLTNGGQVRHTIVLANTGPAATTGLLVNCVLTYSGISPAAYDFRRFFHEISEGWALQNDGIAEGKTLDLTFVRTGDQLASGGSATLMFTCVQPAPPIGSTVTTPLPTPGDGVQSVGVWG